MHRVAVSGLRCPPGQRDGGHLPQRPVRCSRFRCTAATTTRSGRRPAISDRRVAGRHRRRRISSLARGARRRVLDRHRPDVVFYLAGADPDARRSLGPAEAHDRRIATARRDRLRCLSPRAVAVVSDHGRRLRARRRRDRHHPREYHSARQPRPAVSRLAVRADALRAPRRRPVPARMRRVDGRPHIP